MRDGWKLRALDLRASGTAKGSILFMTGRADFYEKYLEAIADLRDSGWNIRSVDWRGQGGSGRTIADPHVGHITDFGIWVDDLAQIVEDWRADMPGPHAVFGHSMGGHLVLRALQECRITIDGAILCAPMIAPKGGGMPDRLAHGLARVMCALGMAEKRAWKASPTPMEPAPLRQTLLTHDRARYEDEYFWLNTNPELLLGPASWRWVEQAYASSFRIRERAALSAVTTPVQILTTSADQLVDSRQAPIVAEVLPDCALTMFGAECAHEILREADPVRDRALAAIRDFLERKVLSR